MRMQNGRPDESIIILAGHEPFTLEIQQVYIRKTPKCLNMLNVVLSRYKQI